MRDGHNDANIYAGRLRGWVVGAYYSQEHVMNRIDRTFLGNTLLGVEEVVPRYRSSSRAAFAQATVRILSGAGLNVLMPGLDCDPFARSEVFNVMTLCSKP